MSLWSDTITVWVIFREKFVAGLLYQKQELSCDKTVSTWWLISDSKLAPFWNIILDSDKHILVNEKYLSAIGDSGMWQLFSKEQVLWYALSILVLVTGCVQKMLMLLLQVFPWPSKILHFDLPSFQFDSQNCQADLMISVDKGPYNCRVENPGQHPAF